MYTSTTYVIGVLVAIITFAVVTSIRNSFDKKSIIATPTIPIDQAVVTASATVRIKAEVEEVFDFIIKYKDPGENLLFSHSEWQHVDSDGVPLAGSIGKFMVGTRYCTNEQC